MTEELYTHPRDCTCPLCQGEPPDWMVEDESESEPEDDEHLSMSDPGEGWLADSYHGQYDDDPNPYHGDYSEE